jgi:hypothetical protein
MSHQVSHTYAVVAWRCGLGGKVPDGLTRVHSRIGPRSTPSAALWANEKARNSGGYPAESLKGTSPYLEGATDPHQTGGGGLLAAWSRWHSGDFGYTHGSRNACNAQTYDWCCRERRGHHSDDFGVAERRIAFAIKGCVDLVRLGDFGVRAHTEGHVRKRIDDPARG